jgi:hypothetical protein
MTPNPRATECLSLPIRMVHLEEDCLRSSTADRSHPSIRATMSVVVYTHVLSTSAEMFWYSTASYPRDSNCDAALASANLRVPTGDTEIVIDRHGED